MEKKIVQWLKRYGKRYNAPDTGYADCDMIDSIIHDLSIEDTNENRKLVGKLVDEYIAAN